MKRRKSVFGFILSALFWLALWQFGGALIGERLLLKIPLVTDTLAALLKEAQTGAFWSAVGTSLWHILAGFFGAVVLGAVFGMLAGVSPFFKALSAPIVYLMRAVPVAAFIIVAWLWLPSAALPSIMAGVMVLPIIQSHVDAGLTAVDRQAVELCEVYGMPKRKILWRVKFKYVSPSLRTGCISGLAIAWKAGVAAEIICNPTGSLGSLLQKAKAGVEYADVFAITLTVIVLSLLLENALKLFWKEQVR